jgi:hypothetical protein
VYKRQQEIAIFEPFARETGTKIATEIYDGTLDKIKAMIDMVAAYPTLTEVSKRAATSYYAGLPKKPFVRKVIGWLKMFG